MGLISRMMEFVFGSGRNVVVETAEVFRENSEAAAERAAVVQGKVLQQYASEFGGPRLGWFDVMIDGLNRLPRPLMAFGTLGLMVSALVEPVWFAERMVGIALVPEPLWWLMGAIVSFYFGARHQAHSQRFQQSVAETMARVPQVVKGIEDLEAIRAPEAPVAAEPPLVLRPRQAGPNAALDEWFARAG